jgi:type I restriction enzyme S subunit
MTKLDRLIAELCPDGGEYVSLGDACKNIYSGKNKQRSDSGKYCIFGSTGIIGYSDTFVYEHDAILIARVGANCGYVHLTAGCYDVSDNTLIIEPNENMYDLKFAYYQLTNMKLNQYAKGGGQPLITAGQLKALNIPIPPLPVQREIVRILDNFTELTAELAAELTARKRQYEYYRSELLTFGDDVPMVTLGEVAKFMNGKAHENDIIVGGRYVVVNSKFVSTSGNVRKFADTQICPVYKDDILMVMSDLPNGQALAKCFLVDSDDKYTLNQRICSLTVKNNNVINTKFLFYIVNRNKHLLRYDNGVDQTNLKRDQILEMKIPLPPLKEQLRIVAILDRFDTLTTDIANGLPAEIEYRRKQYEYYRDKLLSFEDKIYAH